VKLGKSWPNPIYIAIDYHHAIRAMQGASNLNYLKCARMVFDVLLVTVRSIRETESVKLASVPPRNAEFLFYLFLDKKHCEALVGDLEERYLLIFKKFGKHKADFWYWTESVQSVGPVVWAWMKKAALKPVIGLITWAVANGLLEHNSWVVMLVEIWKSIRS
jgi:hypothetical protein